MRLSEGGRLVALWNPLLPDARTRFFETIHLSYEDRSSFLRSGLHVDTSVCRLEVTL